MIISETALRAENNNLTLTRLILASAVIYTHCLWRFTGQESDALTYLIGRPFSGVAVDGFFFLSGFLVYRSLRRRGNVLEFAKARFFRLWPALAVSVVLIVSGGLIAGATFGRETLQFIVKNLLLQSGAYSLSGLECDGRACVVNGSLWTIAWEVRCYAALALLWLVGLGKPKLMAWVVLPATFAFALFWPAVPGHERSGIFYYLDQSDRLWTLFALGIAAEIARHRLVLNWWVAAGLFVLAAVEWRLGVRFHIDALAIGYLVLCFGFKTGSFSGRWPDYSYGMYIYAYPVMMLIWSAGVFSDYVSLAIANAALTLPVAALSWHLVEAPVLDRAKRKAQGRREIGAVAGQAA